MMVGLSQTLLKFVHFRCQHVDVKRSSSSNLQGSLAMQPTPIAPNPRTMQHRKVKGVMVTGEYVACSVKSGFSFNHHHHAVLKM